MINDMIDIDMSVNDNNGHFKGKVGSIEITGLIRFECNMFDFPEIRYQVYKGKTRLKIGDRTFTYLHCFKYAGSLNFNTYRFDVEEATRLINFLDSRADWYVQEGAVSILAHLADTPLKSSDMLYYINEKFI